VPSTPPEAGYGTPEMAAAVGCLLAATPGHRGVFSMEGHEDGVVAYAEDIDAAGRLMYDLLTRTGVLAPG